MTVTTAVAALYHVWMLHCVQHTAPRQLSLAVQQQKRQQQQEGEFYWGARLHTPLHSHFTFLPVEHRLPLSIGGGHLGGPSASLPHLLPEVGEGRHAPHL